MLILSMCILHNYMKLNSFFFIFLYINLLPLIIFLCLFFLIILYISCFSNWWLGWKLCFSWLSIGGFCRESWNILLSSNSLLPFLLHLHWCNSLPFIFMLRFLLRLFLYFLLCLHNHFLWPYYRFNKH
jgi:hypothetical protein